MSKAKYKQGKQICSIKHFEESQCTWFKWNGKTVHRSVLISLQYRTLHDTIMNGRLYEADPMEGRRGMSYDLRIAVKVAGVSKNEPDLYVVIAEPELGDPTYNLGEMFRACTGWDFNQGEFYRVSDVYANINRGIYELTYNEDKYVRMNPPNGWGSTKSALKTLESLRKCIDEIEDPDNWTERNTVPKALMYVAW